MTVITATITNDGHNLLRNDILGTADFEPKYIAFGSSSVTPTVHDHTLGAETYRKAISTYTAGTAVGELLVAMYLGPGEMVGADIEEIGVFGGNTASSSANSGVLIAHALYHHSPKLNTESITGQLDLIV